MSLAFNKTLYIKWFFLATVHAAIAYYLPQFIFQNAILNSYQGIEVDFQITSFAIFSAIIFIVNIKVVLISRSINWINWVSIIGSVLMYYIWIWVGHYLIPAFASCI